MSDLLTVPDVAARLHVTSDYVRRLAARKTLRASRVGRQWLFRADDVEAFVDKRSNVPADRRRRRRVAS